MPVSKCTKRLMCSQVCPQPPFLLGPSLAGQIAVQCHDVPRPQVVAIIPLPRRSSPGTEVREVGSRVVGIVIMVAGRGRGAAFVPAPRRLIAVPELFGRPFPVGMVPDGKHCPFNMIQ